MSGWMEALKKALRAAAFCACAPAFAAIVPESEYTTYAREPIMDWLVAPRTTMCLAITAELTDK